MQHDDSVLAGCAMQLKLCFLKTVLMSRLKLPRKLDPSGLLNVLQLLEMLSPHFHAYKRLVVQDQITADMDIKEAMKIYYNFYLLSPPPHTHTAHRPTEA